MIKIRAFQTEDAIETAQVVKTTLLISNRKDYSEEFIKENIASHSSERLIENAKDGQFFVACDDSKIVGCGGIVGYWGSLTESLDIHTKTE